MCPRDRVLESFSKFHELEDVYGRHFSKRGLRAEECIASLLGVIDTLRTDSPFCVLEQNFLIEARRRIMHIEAHRRGVEILSQGHESLTRHPQAASSSKQSSMPEETWVNAFRYLVESLGCVSTSSSLKHFLTSPLLNSEQDLDLMHISLFYLGNYPLPYETNNVLSTSIALQYCAALRTILSESNRFESANKEDLSRALCHIWTCLSKRLIHVRQFCKLGLGTIGGVPVFDCDGTSFDMHAVSSILKELADLSKGSNLSQIPFQGSVILI